MIESSEYGKVNRPKQSPEEIQELKLRQVSQIAEILKEASPELVTDILLRVQKWNEGR